MVEPPSHLMRGALVLVLFCMVSCICIDGFSPVSAGFVGGYFKPSVSSQTKTTEEILEDLHTNYIELQPLTSRKDFEGCIRNYLECNGPSTALELYEEVVLNNYNAKFSKSRYMKRNAFTAIIRGVDGVVKVGTKKAKDYNIAVYAVDEGCVAK